MACNGMKWRGWNPMDPHRVFRLTAAVNHAHRCDVNAVLPRPVHPHLAAPRSMPFTEPSAVKSRMPPKITSCMGVGSRVSQCVVVRSSSRTLGTNRRAPCVQARG